MLEYQIVSFRPEYLVPVLQLFAANYEKERNQVPALAPFAAQGCAAHLAAAGAGILSASGLSVSGVDLRPKARTGRR